VDGTAVARGRAARTFTTAVSHTEGFDVGEDTISPVDDSYTVDASRFTGELKTLTVEIDG
jgi:hypothetical protein